MGKLQLKSMRFKDLLLLQIQRRFYVISGSKIKTIHFLFFLSRFGFLSRELNVFKMGFKLLLLIFCPFIYFCMVQMNTFWPRRLCVRHPSNFSTFYGLRLVTAAWATRSPWSIPNFRYMLTFLESSLQKLLAIPWPISVSVLRLSYSLLQTETL